jgi:type IV pilus assembly protein PilB
VEEEPDEPADQIDAQELAEEAADAPVITLVNSIIGQAVELGASDIHFEPADGGGLDVRMRVDGVMTDSTTVPPRSAPAIVSRLKIMGNLDISERRRPQDGRIGMNVDGRHIDLRAVVLPLVSGESVVLRVLDQGSVPLGLDELGLTAHDRPRFEEALGRSNGGVLATGPTGSGKSTTLYAALMQINVPEKTIVTIEDPVEYRLPGVKQVQVNEKIGVTFASGLRSMMRADPDTIMVGEMRDAESAKIAIESAITGHLLLSTLHTNDAPTAMTRLTEMGIAPYLVASAINCVIAQRLTPSALRLLPQAHHGPRLRARRRRAGARRDLRGRGLHTLRRLRLPRPHRPVRDHARVRRDPEARHRARLVRPDRRRRRRAGHAPTARGRPRQGARRPDLARRGRPGHRALSRP